MKFKRIFPKGVEVKDGKEHFEECLVEIVQLSPEWHLSPRVMEKGVAEGWMSVAKGRLTLHTPTGDVEYEIVAPPDRSQARNYYDCRVVN